MKRINEKVKDIVEVRPSDRLRDYIAEPPRTLANYHFTDSTSELMAKWLDRIAALRDQSGAVFALAGYRGVGKSHFIATLGALVSNPELRSRVSNSHVASSAQRLMRRHYPIAYIRRGSGETLLDEFKDAIAKTFNIDPVTLPGSVDGLLRMGCELAGDLPLILIVDTAYERTARVSRDDGPLLSEMAVAVKEMNAFLGVALDDDISGADGTNSSIVRTFSIDYLDQEHLYKVVNTHVFPKNAQVSPILQEIYNYFREVTPGFRWSEQRFTSLYPLHPAILEVAPFVRLYVHDFALLGFASEAGEKILGRPANSLIALDEVFDSTENALRKIDDLSEAFVAYDRLNAEVVAQIPVMQRLQAKLILKALLLLSLDGQGPTASEIGGSMLIFDENDPQGAVENVDNLLKTFAAALPDSLAVVSEDGRENRYCFRLEKKDSLNKALADAAASVPRSVVAAVMRRLLSERFSDCIFSASDDNGRRDTMDCQIEWRGGLRRGRLVWNEDAGPIPPAPNPSGVDVKDWEVVIDLSGTVTAENIAGGETSRVVWRPDDLRPNEVDTILRYYVLTTNAEFREAFADQIRAALHSHVVAAEQIFNRVMLDDGRLVVGGFDYNFSEDARSVSQLIDLFTTMLEPLFETRFAEHPFFSKRLGMVEVTTLVSDFYSGSRQMLTEVQNLAATFALPLGLVREDNGMLVPQTADGLKEAPLAAKVLSLAAAETEPTLSLRKIYTELRSEPVGLVREAQHLVLAALVSQRLIEFVTSKGDRINSRSLDLKIIWADIVGVARPVESKYSSEKLDRWAKIIAKDKAATLSDDAGREAVSKALGEWLAVWTESGVLERFNRLSDEILNTRVWQIASRVGKKFGSVAENIRAVREGALSVEECLDRIADIFGDSNEEMDAAHRDVAFLDNFIKGAAIRERVNNYLTVCELTDDEAVEELRAKLTRIVDISYSDPSDANNREMGYLWERFQKSFSAYFAARHDRVMRSQDVQEKFAEIAGTDKWWAYQNLSRFELFDPSLREPIDAVLRDFSEIECSYDVQELLKTRPFCLCSFSLSRIEAWENLPMRLWQNVADVLETYRRILVGKGPRLADTIGRIAAESGEQDYRATAQKLAHELETGTISVQMTGPEFAILRKAARSLSEPEKPILPKESIEPSAADQDTRQWSYETEEVVSLNL